MSFLGTDFFERDVCVVARELVGVELVWGKVSGRILETEAYAAEGDEACHVAVRPSASAFFQKNSAGVAYVYLNYGMYWLLNLLVKGADREGMVLIRALEPLSGLRRMQNRRGGRPREQWCSGPGKLGQALGICGKDHGRILSGPSRALGYGLRASKNGGGPGHIQTKTRVGITRAVDLPWRYVLET
jgi:DNA-3-methyladenine glycosylase